MFLTQDKLQKQPPDYYPSDFKVEDWQTISAAFDDLLQKPIANPMDLLGLLYQTSELISLIYDNYKEVYLQTLKDTNNDTARTKMSFLLQKVIMPTEKRVKEILKVYYEHPYRQQLNPENYRRLNSMAELYMAQTDDSPDDAALEISALSQNYQQRVNLLSLSFEGTTYPIKAVSELLPKVDPAQKETLWHLRRKALIEQRSELSAIMDKLVKARHKEALGKGYRNYLEYSLSTGYYQDMDIAGLSSIHTTIHKVVLPVVKQIIRQRKQSLKQKSIRPWDIEADPLSSALQPFITSDELVEKAIAVLYDIRFEYGILLNKMYNSGFLDLDYRPEKVRGEYYAAFVSYGAGHILMNCTGKHRDMIMLFHEMGHVLQAISLAKQTLGELSLVPIQERELASQSLVYLSTVYWDTFYPDKKERQLALRSLFEQDLILLLHWAILNSFELVLYANPDWTPEQREKAMLDICHQYDWGIDWTGCEEWQSVYWMLENSLFDMPFYSFFSALSIIDVWQIYRNYRHNPIDTMTRFQLFIEQGAEFSIPEIMKELDIKTDYSEHHIRKLIDYMTDEIRKARK